MRLAARKNLVAAKFDNENKIIYLLWITGPSWPLFSEEKLQRISVDSVRTPHGQKWKIEFMNLEDILPDHLETNRDKSSVLDDFVNNDD